ncbi:hypothetical protein HDU97_005077 [Phlyctochytrium planicorne]|nr:hypothetical protein HDU97_005077 [Phlyctochytrium planicorne]
MNLESLVAQHVREYVSARYEAHLNEICSDNSNAKPHPSTYLDSKFLPRLSGHNQAELYHSAPSRPKGDQDDASTKTLEFPHCFKVKDGFAAIIDISGFTRLTNIVEKLSDSGVALIRELLNKPFQKIIEKVHAYNGSVVKFAGDAILAVWSSEFGSASGPRSTNVMILQATLCCLELLFVFNHYELNVPDWDIPAQAAGHIPLSHDEKQEDHHTKISQVTHKKSSLSKKSTTDSYTGADQYQSIMSSASQSSNFALKIHIGLARGDIHHVLVGEVPAPTDVKYTDPAQNQGFDSPQTHVRREYFVVGQAVEAAGKLLGLGKKGELAMCLKTKQGVEKILRKSIDDIGQIFVFSNDGEQVGPFDGFIISASEAAEDQIDAISEILKMEMAKTLLIEREGVLNANCSTLYSDLLSPYIDESLAKLYFDRRQLNNRLHIQPSAPSNTDLQQHQSIRASLVATSSASLETSLASNSSINNANIPSEYNQIRIVTVVFLRLLDYSVGDGASPLSLDIAQKVMIATMASVRMFGGCLRQFNCDDKAASLLMVWGLEGFAHERGEPTYAISAAMMLSKQLQSFLGDEFAIGVCTGKVFSGTIGNSNRADGTILGSCVNLAARFMCDPNCKGNILCDEHSYREAKDEVVFDSPISLSLKGSDHPVKAYVAVSKISERAKDISLTATANNIYGRAKELKIVDDLLQRYMEGEETVRMLLTGASGSGKSTIIDYFRRKVEAESIIVCRGLGNENFRYVLFYGFYGIVLDLFKDLQNRLDEIIANRPISRAGSLQGSERMSFDSKIRRKSFMPKLEIANLQNPSRINIEGVLRAFGEPAGSIQMIDTLFPTIRGEQAIRDPGTNQNNNINRFTRFLIRIINELGFLNHKVCFIFDDIQWVDAKTLYLVAEIMKSCPNLLIAISSRPREEYSKEMAEHFQTILSSDGLLHISLDHLDRAGTEALIKGEFLANSANMHILSKEVINDIFERSQGVPFAVKVLAESLIQNGDTTNSQNVPKDALSAVVAQFDRLPADVKAIFRIAAIAVLKRGKFDIQAPIRSPRDLSQILTDSDRYHFVSKEDSLSNSGSLTFAHYLIQQGILSTIIPKRKEMIHRHFVDYYEKTLGPHNSKTQLILLVQHLLKLPNERNRKLKYTQIAFQEAAEQCMPVEGFMLYKIYENLIKEFKVAGFLTPLQKARHKKLLGLLHFESGNFNEASKHILAAIQELGLRIPKPRTEPLLYVKLALESAFVQFKLFNRPIPEQVQISRKWIKKIAPLAFQNLKESEEFVPLTTSKKTTNAFTRVRQATVVDDPVISTESNADMGMVTLPTHATELQPVEVESYTVNQVAKEVLNIFDMAVRILFQQPGKQLLLVSIIELNISPTFIPYPMETASRALSRVGAVLFAIGLVKLGELFREHAIAIADELAEMYDKLDERGKLSLANTYEFQAVISQFQSDPRTYIVWLRKCIEILESIGYDDAEFAYISRMAIICVNAWANGELKSSMEEAETEYYRRKLSERNQLILKELELCMGSVCALSFNTNDMLQYYALSQSRPPWKETLVGGIWRQNKILKMTLQIEVVMMCQVILLSVNRDLTPWRTRAIKTIKDFELSSLKLDPVVMLPAFTLWYSALPLLLDWIIARIVHIHKLHSNPNRPEPSSSADLDQIEYTAISSFLKKNRRHWKRAPRSKLPVYRCFQKIAKSLLALLDLRIVEAITYLENAIQVADGTVFMDGMFKARLFARMVRMASLDGRIGKAQGRSKSKKLQGAKKVHAENEVEQVLAYFEKSGLNWDLELMRREIHL